MSHKTQNGFTIVELMVVMVVVSIVISIAIPNITQMMAEFRTSKAVGSLISDLNVARTESIKSGVPVMVICQVSPCTGTPINWVGGWLVCYSNNGTTCDTTSTARANPIRRGQALEPGQTLTSTAASVAFYPTGYTNVSSVNFDVGSTNNPAAVKKVAVLQSGSITSLSK
ncbi:MAG: hypothetical protein RL020_276 [Pseudomonadota bacterium]|jgi:prepilin-type N-terminal cleavage/methylation domain-containing protein